MTKAALSYGRAASFSSNMKTLFFSLSCCLLLSVATVEAQDAPPLEALRPSDFVNLKPARCEERTATLDVITWRTPADELIIVVARLGDGETRPGLNRRRLHNVRAFWTEFMSGEQRRKPETIILAEGERVAGHGRLEFYVGGKLVSVIKAHRNSDVDFGDCYPPDDSYIVNRVYDPCRVESHRIFYPCRDRKTRRGKRRD